MYMTLRCTWSLFTFSSYTTFIIQWYLTELILGPQPSPEEVFRKHYAELSRLVSDSTNRLSLAPELFAACLITLECYGSATDNSPKTDIEKGLLLMRGLMSTIKSQPQSLTKIIDSLRKVEAFKLIAENMWTMCVDTDKLKLSRQ